MEHDGEQYLEENSPWDGLIYGVLIAVSKFFNDLAKQFEDND